jgi:hypothetical protein
VTAILMGREEEQVLYMNEADMDREPDGSQVALKEPGMLCAMVDNGIASTYTFFVSVTANAYEKSNSQE